MIGLDLFTQVSIDAVSVFGYHPSTFQPKEGAHALTRSLSRRRHDASEGPGVTLPSVQIAARGVRFQRAAADHGAVCTPREAEGYGR